MANEFGGLLKKYRKKAGLSQSRLVERLREAGYEERYGKADISKWEHGRIPREEVVDDIEQILSTPKGLLLRAAGYTSAAEYKRIVGGGVEPVPVAPHYEDVRSAIREWLALSRGSQELLTNSATVDDIVYHGFGLMIEVEPDGAVAKLSVENKGFYPLLSGHLIPPVVNEEFWDNVESLRHTGTDVVVRRMQLRQEIDEIAEAETGLGLTVSWQREPSVGITAQFGETILRNALGVEQCSKYACFEVAVVYLERGMMVTQVGEGVRLLQGQGLDATLATVYVSTGGAWVIPQGNQRLICNETVEVGEITGRAIRFVLQLHGYVIAIGSLEQIRHCGEVHWRLMQKYAGSPDAKAILALGKELESTSRIISTQLQKAGLHHQFPGICPFCPPSEGDVNNGLQMEAPLK